MDLSEHARRNRAHWDAQSDSYQSAHGKQLARNPMAWGVWSLPEEELRVLGDVAGKDVLGKSIPFARPRLRWVMVRQAHRDKRESAR